MLISASIKYSAEEASEDISVHGPITQSQFLGSLGINFRVEAFLQNCSDEEVESLRTGYWRLVGEGEDPSWEGPDEQVPIGMDTRYLAFSYREQEARCAVGTMGLIGYCFFEREGGEETMGGVLSAILGGGDASAAEDSSSEPSRVTSFHSSARWQLHLNSNKDSNKLMVIDFAATWCGPCKMMEPYIQAMAAKFTSVDFVKIDVDELSDVAQEFKVQAMPTFVLVKSGKEQARIIGAKKDELEAKIKQYSG